MAKKRTGKEKRILKSMWTAVAVLAAIVLVFGIFILSRLFMANTVVRDDGYLYISTGSDFEEVVATLKSRNALKDEASFRWTAIRMNYMQQVKPGRYRIRNGMSNRELVAMLRSGKQK